jgi:hypothetical protein
MNREVFLPPGRHPLDPVERHDPGYPVDDHLYHLGTNLVWAMKHYSDFRRSGGSDPREAGEDVTHLGIALEQACRHFERLEGLLRHGYSASPKPSSGSEGQG